MFSLRHIIIAFLFFPALPLFGAINSQHKLPESAEVQWVICPSSHKSMLSIINKTKNIEVENWSTLFYDTENLELLLKNKIVLRERIRSSGFETVFKKNMSFAEFNEISREVDFGDYKCEIDLYYNYSKIGCSLKNKSKDSDNRFSNYQESELKRFTPLRLNDLRSFGPAKTQAIQFSINEVKAETFVYEIIKLKDKSVWGEVSTRTSRGYADELNVKMQKWFAINLVKVCHPKTSKTQTIMNSYR